MDTDVNSLQESINELVRSMGLDVPNGGGQADMTGFDPNANLYGNSGMGMGMQDGLPGNGAGLEQPALDIPDDFDVDEFLRGLNEGQPGMNGA